MIHLLEGQALLELHMSIQRQSDRPIIDIDGA